MPTPTVATRPPRMTITRFDDPRQVLEAQFNPEELKEATGAEWSKLVVPGNSHPVKQFSHTAPNRFTFTLAFLAITGGPEAVAYLKSARSFLKSIERPRRQVGNIASAGAPRVIFVWPNLLTVVGTVEKCDFTFSRFASNGSPIEAKAAVEIEEIRDTFIAAEDLDPSEVLPCPPCFTRATRSPPP